MQYVTYCVVLTLVLLAACTKRSDTQIFAPQTPGETLLPAIINLHGGGGNGEAALKQTCPNRDLNDPECLSALGNELGFITVFPNGTPHALLRNSHTWNGTRATDDQDLQGFACVSGPACEKNVDHVAFVSDLIDDLIANHNADPSRIYVTGLSNGGAMTHRLGCELADRIAAIAPVASGNQFSAINACEPARPMPILEIHGTEDRCWPMEGGDVKCTNLQPDGNRYATSNTITDWAQRNGCNPEPTVVEEDNDPTDGTTLEVVTYDGCAQGADIVFYRVIGGGHTWPGGSDGLSESIVGRVSREFSANRVMWEFFSHHALD